MSNGIFVSSNVLSTVNIYKMNLNSREFRDFLIKLSDTLSNITNAVNKKTSGLHPLTEFVTSETFFPNFSLSSHGFSDRAVNVMTVDFGALPNATTKSVAHGITFNSSTTFVGHQIWSTSSTLLKAVPIPYSSSTSADIIEVNIDSTNINIKTGKDMTAYDKTIVSLKYLKI